MPNYRYNSPEYMRRNNCGCQVPAPNTAPCQAVPTNNICESKIKRDALEGLPLAMAYVPWQNWYAIYEVEKGFQCGTIFEELNKPFKGMGGCCR